MTFFAGANVATLIVFLLFVAMTLVITAWAARRASSRHGFYAAGESITGLQNGFALAGDYISASTFLGFAAMYFMGGFDAFVYCVGALVAWPVMLFLLADRMRALGRFTLTDVLVHNLSPVPIRTFSAIATLIVLMVYMIGQLVGAGALISLLLGLNFTWSAILVGLLMTIYVTFGGMVATTWVQIIKAVILIGIGITMATWVLAHFDFSPEELFKAAIARHPMGVGIMGPSSLIKGPFAAISLGLTLVFGACGMPHILMRFFTVPDVAQARRSLAFSSVFIGGFFLLTVFIGYGAIALVGGDPAYVDAKGQIMGGNNLASLAVAHALGGNVFLGIVAAAAFATILAVVSGLTLAAAATVGHDLFGMAIRRGKQTEKEELWVSRIAALVFGAIAIALSVLFKDENISFIVITSFAIAASATFPLLALALYWPRLTTTGAMAGGIVGLIAAVTLVVLGPTVWVLILGHEAAIFPYQYPTIVSMPLAFLVAMAVSLLGPVENRTNALHGKA
jgi:cation/acetate symporter